MKYLICVSMLMGTVSFAAKNPSVDLKNLKIQAFAEDKTMSERWKAFMTLVKIKDKESIPDIEMALKSPDWFMRDAAIKALLYIDQKKATVHAKKLLKDDPALIVRTSAVEVLKFAKDKSSAQDLWTAFNDKKNFRKKQSLWIRPRIMSALIEIEDKSISKYKVALNDQDKRIQKMAKYAIERFE